MKKVTIMALITLLGGSINTVNAADAAKGKSLATVCASCHGAAGISHSPLWPNLAGQKAAYLEKQLKDFRGDVRKDPMMTAMAKPLSDQDIADIAAYYSSLK